LFKEKENKRKITKETCFLHESLRASVEFVGRIRELMTELRKMYLECVEPI
jgi:hypothetical protein